jgi:hypothetical protein
MAVKMEIDQGAIHVEQHGINLVPGRGVDMGPRDVVMGKTGRIITDFSDIFPLFAPWCSAGSRLLLKHDFLTSSQPR